MAIALLSHEVCDLTLGKPSLVWLAASASVRAALVALKQNDEVTEISIWDCAPGSHTVTHQSAIRAVENQPPWQSSSSCRCIGKVCMQKIICYLASERSLCNVATALNAPVTVLLEEKSTRVQHIDPEASLYEALAVIAGGVQNLVVPITDPSKKRARARILKGSMSYNNKTMANALALKSHNGHEYCWLTHEDVLRFLLGSICVFSPLPLKSVKDLGIIRTDVMMVGIDEEAISALDIIKTACSDATAVAVVDKNEGANPPFQMVGEIACSTFQACNETAAVALAALSVRDFVTYIQDSRSISDMLTKSKHVCSKSDSKSRHDLSQMLHDLEMWEVVSDDEFGAYSPTGPHDLLRKHHITHFQSSGKAGYMKSHNGPIFCRPTSSLIAVLMQALAHREHYVWVTNEDNTLVGMVTFADILGVLSNHLNMAC